MITSCGQISIVLYLANCQFNSTDKPISCPTGKVGKYLHNGTCISGSTRRPSYGHHCSCPVVRCWRCSGQEKEDRKTSIWTWCRRTYRDCLLCQPWWKSRQNKSVQQWSSTVHKAALSSVTTWLWENASKTDIETSQLNTTLKTTDIKFPGAMVKYTARCFSDKINFRCSSLPGPSVSLFITIRIVKRCCTAERSYNTKLVYSVTGKQPVRVQQPLTEYCGSTMDRTG